MSQNIIQKARQWLGTPFHAQGREKGYGCDCLGLVLGVAKELGKGDILAKLYKYDMQQYNYRSDSYKLEGELRKYFDECSFLEGKIVLFRFSHVHYHVGIVSCICSQKIYIIHACSSIRRVVEQQLIGTWYRAVDKCFSIY